MMRVSDFKINDAPSQAGKVYFITGGTSFTPFAHSLRPAAAAGRPRSLLALLSRSTPDLLSYFAGTGGIGAETVVALANHPSPPAHVYFTGRSEARAKDVIGRCPSAEAVSFIPADLTTLAAVKQSAQTFLGRSDRLDVLITNAGIMDVPSGRTTDGYEIQIGTNHLGHALLFRLLQPTLSKAPDPRLVVLASEAYMIARSTGLDTATFKEDAQGMMGLGLSNYGRSKVRRCFAGPLRLSPARRDLILRDVARPLSLPISSGVRPSPAGMLRSPSRSSTQVR